MSEKEFIYGKLKHLTEQVDFLTDTLMKQTELMDDLMSIINEMQSPEYVNKQVKLAQMKDIAYKMELFKKM